MMSTELSTDPLSDLTARPRDIELSTHRSSLTGWGLVLFAVVWNVIAWGVFVAFWLLGDGSVFPLLMVGFFALIGLAIIVAAIKYLMARSKLHPPRITLSVQPLCIGEAFTGRFAQEAKSNARIEAVTVTLLCRESATYTRGTDTTTVHQDVFTERVTLAEESQADPLHPIQGEFQFRIPDDAMHSFAGKNNKILWLLTTHTAVAGWPDDKAEFVAEVIPRRAPAEETA